MRNTMLAKALMGLGFSVEGCSSPVEKKSHPGHKIESAPNRMSQKKRRQRARWKN